MALDTGVLSERYCQTPHVVAAHIRSVPAVSGGRTRQSARHCRKHGFRPQCHRLSVVRAAHLHSKEDLQDGSILFRFGDEPSTLASEDSETLPEQTQQAEHSSALTSATPEPKQQQQAAVGAVQEQVGTTNNAQEQADEEDQPVILASEDSADEETSDSETASEALANMTPDKLENMKVAELRNLCKQEHVKGYSKLKKEDLVSLLQKQLQS